MRWLPLTGAAEVLDNSSPRETMSPIRVAIADDHTLFREGLKSLLCLQVDVTVVAELEHTTGLLLVLEQTPCDVLLADLEMEWSALCDFEAIAERVPLIVMTIRERPEEWLGLIQAGARGVVFKRFVVETMMPAIRAVADGQVWIPPPLHTAW